MEMAVYRCKDCGEVYAMVDDLYTPMRTCPYEACHSKERVTLGRANVALIEEAKDDE